MSVVGHMVSLDDVGILLGLGISDEETIGLLSEVASLVQGYWVIKSNLVFEPSADAGLLEKARLADEQKKDFRDTIVSNSIFFILLFLEVCQSLKNLLSYTINSITFYLLTYNRK